jgi:hypothetical protein
MPKVRVKSLRSLASKCNPSILTGAITESADYIEELEQIVQELKEVISRCRCEECGNELGNATEFSYGILCKDCMPVELDY